MNSKEDLENYLALLQLKYKHPEDLIKGIGGATGVNDWGSCRYAYDLNTFIALNKLTDRFGGDAALDILHLKISYDGVRPIDTVWKEFIKKYSNNTGRSPKQLRQVPGSADNMFKSLRDAAWDLWSTAPYVAYNVFENLNVTMDGRSANDDPIIIGVCCWLLYSNKLITGEPNDVFGGFDT